MRKVDVSENAQRNLVISPFNGDNFMAVTRRTFIRLGTAAGVTVAICGAAGRNASAAIVDTTTPPPLKFTKYYVGRTGRKIIRDRRFKNLLPSLLPNHTLPYWSNKLLHDSLPTFFSIAQPVSVDHMRWVTVETAVAHDGRTRGLLWLDTGSADKLSSVAPTVVWANLITDGETSSLYLFSDKQVSFLSPSQVTNNLKMHLGRWLSRNPRRYQAPVSKIVCTAADKSSSTCLPEQLGVSRYFFSAA